MHRFVSKIWLPFALFCFLLPGARASVTRVQSKSAPAGGNSNPVTFSGANTAGNTIIVSVGWLNGGTATISDSNNNLYTSALVTANGFSSEIWYASNIAAGTNTVTVTFSEWNNSIVSVFEYSGLATSAALDVVVGNTGNSNSLSSGNITTTQANDLLFGTGYGNSGGTLTEGVGYSMQEYSTWAGTHLGVETQSVTSTGTYNATFPDTEAWTWTAQVAAFKAAVSSDAPSCGISGDATNYVPSDSDWGSPYTPAKGSSYTDATFGCQVTRITNVSSEDWQTYCGASGCYLPIQHGYATVSPFNANDTFIMLSDGWSNRFITDMQGNILVPGQDMSPSSTMPSSTLDSYMLWDATDPNVFYFTNQNTLGKATISQNNGTYSVSTTTLTTFSAYQAVSLFWDSDVSQDGTHVALVGGDTYGCEPNCSPLSVFVYDLSTNTGQPDPTPGVYTLTSCSVSSVSEDQGQDGCIHRVLLTPDNNVIINFVNDGTGLENGYRLWAGTTTDNNLCGQALCHLQDGTNHIDTGSDMDGNAIFIEVGNSQTLSTDINPCTSGWGSDIRRIYAATQDEPPATPDKNATCMLDVGQQGVQSQYHVSYRGSSSQPWLALSFFDLSTPSNSPGWSPEYFNNAPSVCGTQQNSPCYAPPSQDWPLYQDEIMVIRIDENNNPPSPGVPKNNTYVYRLARAYSRSVGLPPGNNYDADPKASISRDGKYIAFDSTMAFPNGCPTNFQDNISCSDVYVIKVK